MIRLTGDYESEPTFTPRLRCCTISKVFLGSPVSKRTVEKVILGNPVFEFRRRKSHKIKSQQRKIKDTQRFATTR